MDIDDPDEVDPSKSIPRLILKSGRDEDVAEIEVAVIRVEARVTLENPVAGVLSEKGGTTFDTKLDCGLGPAKRELDL